MKRRLSDDQRKELEAKRNKEQVQLEFCSSHSAPGELVANYVHSSSREEQN